MVGYGWPRPSWIATTSTLIGTHCKGEIDFRSIDIDCNDIYILETIDVVVEYIMENLALIYSTTVYDLISISGAPYNAA